jgi:hypothetical protein
MKHVASTEQVTFCKLQLVPKGHTKNANQRNNLHRLSIFAF